MVNGLYEVSYERQYSSETYLVVATSEVEAMQKVEYCIYNNKPARKRFYEAYPNLPDVELAKPDEFGIFYQTSWEY